MDEYDETEKLKENIYSVKYLYAFKYLSNLLYKFHNILRVLFVQNTVKISVK